MNDRVNRDSERHFEARTKAVFRAAEQALDPEIRERLGAARAAAVEAAGRSVHAPWHTGHRRWLAPLAAAVVTAAVLVLLPERTVDDPPPRVAAESDAIGSDLDLLLAADSLSMYEDLEFYAVLEYLDDDDAGSG